MVKKSKPKKTVLSYPGTIGLIYFYVKFAFVEPITASKQQDAVREH